MRSFMSEVMPVPSGNRGAESQALVTFVARDDAELTSRADWTKV